MTGMTPSEPKDFLIGMDRAEALTLLNWLEGVDYSDSPPAIALVSILRGLLG